MGMFTFQGRNMMIESIVVPDMHVSRDTLWVALCTKIPDLNSSSVYLDEPRGNGYERASYSTGKDFWAPSGYCEYVNTKEVRWRTATGPWGRLNGWALTTDLSGGQVIAAGPLSASDLTVGDGSVVMIPQFSLRLGQALIP